MTEQRIIAIIGATGSQGGGVLRALQAQGAFRTRALTRHPGKHQGLADEVVLADLNEPETLRNAFEGAHGVFAVTNFWSPDTEDEREQARAAIDAARAAGVKHFVWSTLPDVDQISGGKYEVPHFEHKAEVDAMVADAGFDYHTFVHAPFYFQNLRGPLAPQPQDDGTLAWFLPISGDARVIHMGDVSDLGKVVAGVFAHPEDAGHGQHFAAAQGVYSFEDVAELLRAQGEKVSFNQIPTDAFATAFPGAEEMAAMLGYFADYTYMGPQADQRIAAAHQIATAPFTSLEQWVSDNFGGAR